MPIIPAPRGLRQEALEFEVSLSYQAVNKKNSDYSQKEDTSAYTSCYDETSINHSFLVFIHLYIYETLQFRTFCTYFNN
jgi:hypothetical protein